jgi:putative aldouronate transport system substrate-binding protein
VGNQISTLSFIPTVSKNAEAVVKLLDYMSTEGIETLQFGFEGDVWRRENGKRVIDSNKSSEQNYRHAYNFFCGATFIDLDLERLGQFPPELKLIEGYKLGRSQPIANEFDGLPTRSIARLVSQLSTMEQEALIEFATGKRDFGAWKAYTDQWYAQGGQQLTDEINEWYKNNK